MRSRLPAGRRGEIINSLYFEGDQRRPYLWRFSLLMTLSIAIATYGIQVDGEDVVVDVVGKGRPSGVDRLILALENQFGRELKLSARYGRRFDLGEPVPTDLLPGAPPGATAGSDSAHAWGA